MKRRGNRVRSTATLRKINRHRTILFGFLRYHWLLSQQLLLEMGAFFVSRYPMTAIASKLREPRFQFLFSLHVLQELLVLVGRMELTENLHSFLKVSVNLILNLVTLDFSHNSLFLFGQFLLRNDLILSEKIGNQLIIPRYPFSSGPFAERLNVHIDLR